MMTVICLDDYHTNDRAGRKVGRRDDGAMVTVTSLVVFQLSCTQVVS